jgi:hypothetical protein
MNSFLLGGKKYFPIIISMSLFIILFISTTDKLLTYNVLASRKALVLIGNFVFMAFFLFILFRFGMEKVLFFMIALFPFWIRGMYYFGFDILPNNFNYLTLDIIVFFLVSFTLVLKTFLHNNIYINNIFIYILLISIIYISASMLNIYIRDGISYVELEIFILNFLFPIFMILSLYFYLFNASDFHKNMFIKAIYYFYLVILIYALVELFVKGQHLLVQPSLFLENGLRQSSGTDGSQIISGGLRDILYFSFLEAMMPLFGIMFYKNNLISLKTYKKLLLMSLFFVFSIFSKGPMVLILINIYFANKIVKIITFKSMKYVIPLIVGLFTVIGAKLIERLERFGNVFLFLAEDGIDSAMNEEASSAGRIINMMNRFQEFKDSPWIGKSELTLTNDIFISLFSSYGIITSAVILYLLYLIYLNLNILGKYISISLFIFSLVELGTMFSIGGVATSSGGLSRNEYIEIFGWLPYYSNANVYISSILLLATLLNTKKGDGICIKNVKI